MTNWFRFWSRAYVLHLEDEILWLRQRLDMERNRAEVAIDNLVSVRVTAPVMSTVQPRNPAIETPEEIVGRLHADPEFAEAGSAA